MTSWTSTNVAANSADRGALRNHKKVNVLGLCDIDANRLAKAKKETPMAETYSDYREIFEKMGSLIENLKVPMRVQGDGLSDC